MSSPSGDAVARIDDAVDAQHDAQLDFLRTLVRYPSVLGQEAEAQAFMAETFREAGLDVDHWPVRLEDIRELPGFSPVDWSYEGKSNVVGAHRPDRPQGRSLVLNGHIDVVPAGPETLWSHPPFEPVLRDGRLFGRGAGDMKAGIAAYLYAFLALRRAGFEPAADVFLQSVVEEECTGNGALACIQRGYRADAAVIPEPFDLMVAQVGVLWLHVTVHGRPTHVLEATAGADAIRIAQELIEDLRGLEEEANAPERRPPQYRDAHHPINFNVGRLEGGEWTSSVPAACAFSLRVGFFPGTSPEAMRRRLEERIGAFAERHPVLRDRPPTIRYAGFQAEGCTIDPTSEPMRELSAAHADVHGESPATYASTATSDARAFNLHGDTIATCYGPAASGIHGIDESVDLASVHRVTRVLARFIARWCGVRPI